MCILIRRLGMGRTIMEYFIIINTGGSSANNDGIYIVSSYQNNVTNNYVNVSGTNDNYGMPLSSISYNIISYNVINTTGTSYRNYGMGFTGTYNDIRGNNLSTGGQSSLNEGIDILEI